MMKNLDVPFLSLLNYESELESVSRTLDDQEKHLIDQLSWKEYPYKPEVKFSIGHSGDCLYMKYVVSERTVRASYFQANEPVYKDSCVEFFIAFDGQKNYYNLEFNAIGTCKFNYGDLRDSRKLISKEAISRIRFSTTINNRLNAPEIFWAITLVIPLNVFEENNLGSLHGKEGMGNFYKCGDELPEPHFLSWKKVEAPAPDFHVPSSFGKIYFQ